MRIAQQLLAAHSGSLVRRIGLGVEAAPVGPGACEAVPFTRQTGMTHFVSHKWLTWGGWWAILKARAVPRLHVYGKACPDNAAGWGNRGGLTGSSFCKTGPPRKHPLTRQCAYRFIPGGSVFPRLSRGAKSGSIPRASPYRSFGNQGLAFRRECGERLLQFHAV